MKNGWRSESDTARTKVIGVAGVAALLVFIGSFLPWVTASVPLLGNISISGTEGGRDGVLTVILATISLLALGVLFVSNGWRRIKPVSILILLLGLAITSIGGYDYAEIQKEFFDDPEVAAFVSVGIGLYMVLIGGVALTGCAGFSVFKCFRDQ